MKHGFMLIELIIATLVASMVAGILLTALAQGTRFQAAVDNVISSSLRIGIATNQLEKDLMGAFVPRQAELSDKNATQEEDDEETPVVADDKKNPSKKSENASSDKKDQKKEKPKPLEKIFYATNKDGHFDTLTFITNNPLVVFVGKDVGVVKPKIARVTYSLKPESDNEQSYALYRQESNELDLAQYKNVRSYEVISGIKSLSITYTARIEKQQEKQKSADAQSQEKPKISYEYKTSKDWVSERKKEGDKEQEQEFPRIPHSIEIKLILWDNKQQQENEYTLCYEIPIDSVSPKKPAPQKKIDQPTPPKPEEQPNTNAITIVSQSDQRIAFNSRSRKPVTADIENIEAVAQIIENLAQLLTQQM